MAMVPRFKSLLHAPDEYGLPIGNLTSQFFANIYLNEVDQHAKHVLKVKHYGRYVDDIIMFGESGSELRQVIDSIDEFAQQALSVKLHPRKTYINKIEKGFSFVGYVVKPYVKYIKRSTMSNLMRKMEDSRWWHDADICASVNSYLGFLRHVDGYGARRKICQRMEWLGYASDNARTKIFVD